MGKNQPSAFWRTAISSRARRIITKRMFLKQNILMFTYHEDVLHLLFRNYCKKYKVFFSGVNKTVCMSLWTIMTISRLKTFLCIIIYSLCITAQNIDYLTVSLMFMQSYRRTRCKFTVHNLSKLINMHFSYNVSYASFKFRNTCFLHRFKIYYHIIILLPQVSSSSDSGFRLPLLYQIP